MDLVFLSLLIWVVFQTAGTETNLGTINCRTSVKDRCPLNEICSGFCSYPCADVPRNENDPKRQIWGTKIYTYESAICKAATHDRRISTWHRTERSFTLQRIPFDGNYWPSVRSGIHSYSHASLTPAENNSFIFLSPRVKEKIFDVASIREQFLLSNGEDQNSLCFGGINITSVFVKTLVPDTNQTPTKYDLEYRASFGLVCFRWPPINGEDETSDFEFTPEDSMLSVVTSIIMSPNADFYPATMTYVANINENVTLVMKENSVKSTSCMYTWKKDGESIHDLVSQSAQQRTSLFLSNVQEGAQGIYSLECDSSFTTRGQLRLIVRGISPLHCVKLNCDTKKRLCNLPGTQGCPANSYGDNCTEQCPECKNGGVCHDITGVCICPPGYNGTTCESACPSGHFGQTCEMHCFVSSNSPKNEPSCQGYLICLPDPYGCSCACGYKGILCNESYPVLTEEITLERSTSDAITISFREWDPYQDIGNGTPSAYKVYYKMNYDGEPWMSKVVPAVYPNLKRRYTVILENLAADTEYVVRVVVLDVIGRSQEDGVKEHFFSTRCGTPSAPPLHINVSAEERRVFVSWELPSERFWNCRTIVSFVRYGNHYLSKDIPTSDMVYSFSSRPFTSWTVTICIGQGRGNINCAKPTRIMTKQDAPGRVPNFSPTRVNSRSIYLRWDYPYETNGVLKYFILRYRQTGWKHQCEEGFDDSTKIQNVSRGTNVLVRNLKPSASYDFELTAVTVKEGPGRKLSIATKVDIPSTIPQYLSFEESQHSLKWRRPPCSQTNGELDVYMVSVKDLSSDQPERNSMTRDQIFKPDTKPLTNYTAKVYATTKAGIGNTYASIRFTTPEKGKIEPTSLQITTRTEDSIRVIWEPPENITGTLRYKVNFSLLRHGYSSTGRYFSYFGIPVTFYVDGSQNTFSDLQPASTYMISVEVNTSTGFSRPLFEVVRTRLPAPEEPRAPEVLQKTKDTIRIKIFPALSRWAVSIRYYFVVVKIGENRNNKNTKVRFRGYDESFFAPKNCEVVIYGNEYVAARLESSSVRSQGTDLTVGDGKCIDKYYNQPLHSDTSYRIGIAIMTQDDEDSRYSHVTYTDKEVRVEAPKGTDVYGIILGTLIFLIVVVFILILIFVMPKSYLLKARRKVRQSVEMLPWRGRRRQPDNFSFDNMNLECENGDDTIDTESIAEDISHVIEVKYLDDYVAESLSHREMKKEFKALPRGQKYPCRTARLPHNRQKNRYGNLLPYDHSRVKLKHIPEKPYSDYINANYVCGYKNEKRYIATQAIASTVKIFFTLNGEQTALCQTFDQLPSGMTGRFVSIVKKMNYAAEKRKKMALSIMKGPLPKTVNDFWTMVWTENSCKIFMVTNLVEQGRIKCDKYWPDETSFFGSIIVTLKDSQTLADFIIRTFEIRLRKQKRELKQYHYRIWPDHGIPPHTASVVRLLKKARDYQPDNTAPIIVHCSAGVGRTGALILLDSMLEMGIEDKKVDVCGHLCEMRKKRTSLLENLEQYVFVYKALAQALCWDETSIPSTEFASQIGNLRTPDPVTHFSPVEMQYQAHTGYKLDSWVTANAEELTPSTRINLLRQGMRLGNMCPRIDNVDMRVARLPDNAAKNRTMEILPPERARPILKTTSDEESTYINAVYVNGYKERDAFLVTQYPLPNTISDFWQMITETKSRTIVLLQNIDFTDPTCPQYWPSEGETVFHGKYQVQCISVKTTGDISTWNIILKAKGAKESSEELPIPIQLFHYFGWSVGQSVPQDPKTILDLIDTVEKKQRGGKHAVTVQCLNGSTACGLFCATMLMCSKIISEKEVDIFMTVQNVRTNRPEFIECIEQYDFLFDMAVTFLDNFGAHANFK